VRPSGTERSSRVMVEAPTDEEADSVCGQLVACADEIGQKARRAAGRPEAIVAVSSDRCVACCYVGAREGGPTVQELCGRYQQAQYRGMLRRDSRVIDEERIEAVRGGRQPERAEATLDSAAAGHGDRGRDGRLAPGDHGPIGHTRWATHGRVSEENAHPHFDSADRITPWRSTGSSRNYMELKERMVSGGSVFTSENGPPR